MDGGITRPGGDGGYVLFDLEGNVLEEAL